MNANTIKSAYDMAVDMAEDSVVVLIGDSIAEIDATNLNECCTDVEYTDEDFEVLAAQVNGGSGVVVAVAVDGEVEFILS